MGLVADVGQDGLAGPGTPRVGGQCPSERKLQEIQAVVVQDEAHNAVETLEGGGTGRGHCASSVGAETEAWDVCMETGTGARERA